MAENKNHPPIFTYGPERPYEEHSYEMFRTPKYLSRYSKKILQDLVRVAKHYSGKVIHLFFVNKEEQRCRHCTNELTGERILSDCPVCHGTGFENSWDYQGKYYCNVDFTPIYESTGDAGNSINPGGVRDMVTVLGTPLIHDQDLILFEDTKEVYKVITVEPAIIALQGDVISQAASVSRVDYGSPEYNILEKLPY